MTPTPQEQRADLLEQKKNADAGAAQARNKKAAAEARKPELDRALERLREEGIRSGMTAQWRSEFMALSDERAANAAGAIDHEATLKAAENVARKVQTQLDYLLYDELDVFMRDATALSRAAVEKLRAALPAISEAIEASQRAQLEWATLAPALRQTLRERDEARGTYRDAGVYTRLAAYPAFPVAVSDPNWTATPPGTALLTPARKKVAV